MILTGCEAGSVPSLPAPTLTAASSMSPFQLLQAIALLLLCGSLAQSAQLRYRIDEKEFSPQGIASLQPYVVSEGGAKEFLEPGGTWRLAFDAAEDPRASSLPLLDYRLQPGEAPGNLEVFIMPEATERFHAWTEAQLENAIFALAWYDKGEIIGLTAAASPLAQLLHFKIPETARHGHPRLFAFQQGALLSPTPKQDDLPWLAAANGDIKTLMSFPKASLSVSREGETLLHVAAINGQAEIVQFLLSEAKLKTSNKRKSDEATPLLLATSYNRTQSCLKLLEADAYPNTRDASGSTPLIWAAANGNLELLKTLLQSKAKLLDTDLRIAHRFISRSIKTESREGMPNFIGKYCTALYVAAEFGHGPIVQHLLATSKDPAKLVPSKGQAVRVISGLTARNETAYALEALQTLAPKPGFGNAQHTLMHRFARFGTPEQLQRVLEYENKLDAPSPKDGETPLHWAIQENNLDAIRWFIANGARLNPKSDTPLHWKAINDANIEALAILLDNGTDPNATRMNDPSHALTHCIHQGKFEHALLLLQHGASWPKKAEELEGVLARLIRDDPARLLKMLLASETALPATVSGIDPLSLAHYFEADQAKIHLATSPSHPSLASTVSPNPPLTIERENLSGEQLEPFLYLLSQGGREPVDLSFIAMPDGRLLFPKPRQPMDKTTRKFMDTSFDAVFLQSSFLEASPQNEPYLVRLEIADYRSEPSRILEAHEVDTPAKPHKKILPQYPYALKYRGLFGQTIFKVVVDQEGKAQHAHLINSSRSEFEELDKKFALKTDYEPASRNGQAVSSILYLALDHAPPQLDASSQKTYPAQPPPLFYHGTHAPF